MLKRLKGLVGPKVAEPPLQMTDLLRSCKLIFGLLQVNDEREAEIGPRHGGHSEATKEVTGVEAAVKCVAIAEGRGVGDEERAGKKVFLSA